ncbi:integrase domain-containing protein, partial [Arsenophonus nasoniae]|uniref:integrase domain-containing protein n=1 Tax=Arsenophonus nasoniae TaxID=638 RepID=UPI00387A65B5
GDGLELLAKVSGSRRWYYRYYKPITQKRTMIGLGEYPAIGLADARRLKDDYKALLVQNIDPLDWCKQQQMKVAEENNNTLEKVAMRWIEIKRSTVTKKYVEDIWRSLEKDIFPKLGHLPVTTLKAPMLIDALKSVETRGNLETVKRLTQRIVELMNFAMNTGIIEANPFTTVGKAFPISQTKHHPTIKPTDLPKLMKALSVASIERTTRLAIEWQLLTAMRPGEAVQARWAEIDFNNKQWNVPAKTMKMNKLHIVPLSQPALDILEVMKSISGQREYVFPHKSDPKKCLNSQTPNTALKRMGFKGVLTSHGMRSIVSTAMNEAGFMPDAIEAVLAHGEKNSVRAAYNRATYLEQRKEMMEWWGQFVKSASIGDMSVAECIKGLKILEVNNG